MYQELELWREYQAQIKDQLSKNEGVETNHTKLTKLEKVYIAKQYAQWEFDSESSCKLRVGYWMAKSRAEQQFDKWMAKLIKRNGTTQY